MWHKAVQGKFENFLLYLWAFDRYFPNTTMVSNLSLQFHQGEKQKSAVITSAAKAV